MKVKICGITSADDAQAAVDAGADALGFVFVDSSPRSIPPGLARTIISGLPPFITPVAVVMNRSRKELRDIIDTTGIRCIQFHGDEKPEDIQGYPVPVYKAFRVSDAFDIAVLKEFDARTHLLDSFVEGEPGGTGTVLNWQVAVKAKKFGNIILAGGIRPENVIKAVRQVRPYAIDVNSGVESAPGKKDPVRLRELFAALQKV